MKAPQPRQDHEPHIVWQRTLAPRLRRIVVRNLLHTQGEKKTPAGLKTSKSHQAAKGQTSINLMVKGGGDAF
jgi:hypothetical protein